MNFVQFLKSLYDGIEPKPNISVNLWLPKYAKGLQIRIDWENDFHFLFVLLEKQIENQEFLRYLSAHMVARANKAYRVAEVGED